MPAAEEKQEFRQGTKVSKETITVRRGISRSQKILRACMRRAHYWIHGIPENDEEL